MPPRDELWPELPYDAWRETKDTLHMKLQVVGKVRLALAPMEPQWANVPLYLTARGLNSSPIRHPGGEMFDVDVDFSDHEVRIRAGNGLVEVVPLRARPVAEFYEELLRALERAGVPVELSVVPSEVADPIPFPEDTRHASYEPDWAWRFWRAMLSIDAVLKEHRAGFRGKTSPVHFFWGSFDLALTRYSGRPADPPPDSDTITSHSADAEQIAAGWWPGDARVEAPTFFAYALPRPDGIEGAQLAPADASWSEDLGEFLLPYEAVRQAADPRRALLDFLRTTYEAGARLGGWDPALTG